MQKNININQIFENIDRELIEKGVSIPSRHMKATEELSKYFGNILIPLSSKSLPPKNDFGNRLCIWLDNWYRSKYGKNNYNNFDLGFFYQKIRGDLWHYRVPMFFGTCNFFTDKDLQARGAHNETNILRMSDRMTQAYANSLTELELEQLTSTFDKAIKSFEIIDGWKLIKIDYYNAIKADFKIIESQLIPSILNYSQARWAYLQCAEKILKSWLLKAGITEDRLKRKYGHNLHKLVNAFNKHYELQISSNKLEDINCSADARYGDSSFTSDDVIKSQEWLFNLIQSINYKPKLINHNESK